MRKIPQKLATHLDGEATTTCFCWRLVRRDGTVLGFTDHDEDVATMNATFRAASGFVASGGEVENGLAAPSRDVLGALSSDVIDEHDIAGGLFDGARVELHLVNWADPSQHLLLNVMEIGEITRTARDFRAELRAVTHRLGEPRGRSYGHLCDANFGDARCGKSLAGLKAGCEVVAISTNTIRVSGAGAFSGGAFDGGAISFTSGLLAGQSFDIDTSRKAGGKHDVTPWLRLPVLPAAGDACTLTAGCDKTFSTCRDRFSNALNFRGFPHMPGTDFSYSYADGDSEHDGSPLFD